MTTVVTQARTASRLPHVLATLYAVAVVYASLQPFGPWMPPPAATPFWLWAANPFHATHFDVLLNIVAYVPLGLFTALVPRRASPVRRIAIGTLAGAALAFTMESLQAYVPTRDASVYDLASNTLGAGLGALLAARVARNSALKRRLAGARARWILPGALGDIGLSLLALWLVAQCNPAIGLFAITWDPAQAGALAHDAPDLVSTVVDALETTLQFAGMGLFLALLVRVPARLAMALVLLLVVALAGKSAAALNMLRPAPWESWLRPNVALGIALGAVLLMGLLRLPRAAQVIACAIVLLLSVGVPALVADPEAVRVPLTLFNWRYGQLLNFNGLTHTVLLLWPLAAALWLFALAGQPAWGATAPEDAIS